MRRSPLPFTAVIGGLLVAGAVGAACQPPVGQQLSDPREIVSRTIASTAALRTAALRLDFQVRAAPDPDTGGVALNQGATVEGEVDLAAGEWSIRGATNDGSGNFTALLVDKTMYTQADGAQGGRWTAVPFDGAAPAAFLMLGGGGMNVPDYGGILQEAIAGPAVRAQLTGVEDCPSGRCYHVGVEIPREQVWPLLARLSGLDQVPAMAQQAPPVGEMPTLSLAVVVDAATLYLVSVDLSGAVPASTFQARLELRKPNEPVSIVAPPAHLVDRMEGGMFGGGVAPARPAPAVIDEVGEPVEAQP